MTNGLPFHYQPIEGLRVQTEPGFISFPGFELHDYHSATELLMRSSHFRDARVEAELHLESMNAMTFIVVRRAQSDRSMDFARYIELESVPCAAVLSVALWVESDLRYTVHLRHEAYQVKGNAFMILGLLTTPFRRRDDYG